MGRLAWATGRYFNSRPYVRGDMQRTNTVLFAVDFNSRPYVRGDRLTDPRAPILSDFNSRPYVRGDLLIQSI